jgi:hypothetical protein
MFWLSMPNSAFQPRLPALVNLNFNQR